MLNTIRTKLTLWYTVILTLILAFCSLGVYSLLKHELRERLDESLEVALETVGSMLVSKGEESDFGRDSIVELINVLHFSDIGIAIYDGTGKKLAERMVSRYTLPSILPPDWLRHRDRTFLSWKPKSSRLKNDWRIAIQQVSLEKKAYFFYAVAFQSQKSIKNLLDMLKRIFFLIMPVAIILAGLSGWLFAKKSLAPVAAMTEQVQHIYADNLNERLLIKQPRDEIGRLAHTFNDLLSRLQSAFQTERRFMADAAHELRTPLYVARAVTDVTLKQPNRSEIEYREALVMISQQERRLTRIVEDLFLLGCADDRGRRLEMTDFYLDEMIYDTVKIIKVLADQKGVRVETVAAPEILYRGDEELLKRMLLNLLDNAVKYTQSGSSVVVSFRSTTSAVLIEVADSGPGMPMEVQSHIFERFYRDDQARSHTGTSTSAGAGLGLPIARWIAESHGGNLNLSQSDSRGSVFTITLPIVAKPAELDKNL